jgi:nicotinamidase-related amidase
MKPPAHGGRARSALLLVDFINPMDFAGANALAPRAIAAAAAAARLKSRLKRAGVPVIYANDNFGAWRSDFTTIVDACRRGLPAAHKLVATIAPAPEDLSILKPRHSAFFGTPLEFLLDELHVNQLIIAGLTTDNCVMFTAHDAYLRKLAVLFRRTARPPRIRAISPRPITRTSKRTSFRSPRPTFALPISSPTSSSVTLRSTPPTPR